ncbi:MAG TPA: thiol reductant ABC exporter subunit CydD [Candidatus Limnocylindrales bacterium]|jgi:ATP-binding cassette subfamily C protein CydD|nr:thiol reductant ABC exporter subunit CydD [Candidatus Limnocylindrales bacterium]
MADAGTRPIPAERRLLARTAGARSLLAAGIACGFAAAMVVVASAYLTSVVVSDVFLDGATLAAVAPALVLIGVLAIGRLPLLVAGDWLTQRAADRVKARLRADLTLHLLALGPGYTGRERSGELAAVVVSGSEAIEASVTLAQPARALAVAVPLLVLAAVAVVDPPTVLVLVVTGPVLVLLLAVIGGRAGTITERRFAELRWLSAFFLDILQGISTLKLFGRSVEQVDTIRDMSRRYGDTTMEVLRTAFQTSLVLEWGAAVAVALVAVEISLRLMAGAIAFDRALAVLIIVPEFFLPLRTLATRYHAGAAGRTAAERIDAILAEPVTSAVAAVGAAAPMPSAATATVHSAAAPIRFSAVTVTYPGRDVPALDGLELTIPPRSVVALVGPTGAGKTTVANVLLRFVDPDAGRVLVGDVPLDTIDPARWRAEIAWVPQRPHLFHGTVADNIRLARPDADDASIRAAAVEAGADDFIAALPAGYATPVGEDGVRLSGGQRQRVAIARAFLADARLVILDEPTSHLDTESEAIIRESIRRLALRRTVLIVSHRLRLVSSADLVVVLDHGRVVESGRPAELAAREGHYSRSLAAGDEAERS